jgi:hypothetical protein
MSGTPAELLKDWHDFYMLIGGAAATLVGLTFVAASIGAGTMTKDHEVGLNAFITQTVVHFSAVLFACLFIVAPFDNATVLAAVLFCESVAGIAYSIRVWLTMRRHGFADSVDLADRVWYALAPIIGYVVLASATILHNARAQASLVMFAGGLGLLLLAGIRNAWDMALWIMMRPKKGE